MQDQAMVSSARRTVNVLWAMLRDRTNYREVPLAPDNRLTGYPDQRRIRTTNGVVRLDNEIPLPSRAMSIFVPTESSAYG
jgi:hypothetical protein